MKRWRYLFLLLFAVAVCYGVFGMGEEDYARVLQDAAGWFQSAAEKLSETSLLISEREIQNGEAAYANGMQAKTVQEKQPAYAAEGEVVVDTAESAAYEQGYSQSRAEIGLIPENDAALLQSQSGYYAFSCLTEQEQLLYVDMVQILSYMARDVEIRIPEGEGPELSVIGKVFQCVMNDHPEFFYADGYTYIKYTEASALEDAALQRGGVQSDEDEALGRLIRVTFSGTYTMSPAKRQRCEEQIKEYTDRFLADIPANASEYERVKQAYEYVILNTDYVLNSREDQNICSVFLYGESVCQGYAKALQYLLQKLDVQAYLVAGTVEKNESHVWNLVQIDGDYYYVDATWGDASYEPSGESAEKVGLQAPKINYDYLCVTTEQMEQTHQAESVVELPVCDAVKANYYRMEHAYFTDYDRDGIRELFERAYARGDELVTIKCSDYKAYEEVKRMLLEAQEVFDYLQNANGQVAYTDSYEQCSISFWL